MTKLYAVFWAAPCPIFLSSGGSARDTPFNIANVRASETRESPPSSTISVLLNSPFHTHIHTDVKKLVLIHPDLKMYLGQLDTLLTHTMKHNVTIY